MLRAEVDHAFQYISEDNEHLWLPAFRDTVRLRFHPLAELRRNHRPMTWRGRSSTRPGSPPSRLRGRRALLDDPYAVFAAPWTARRLGCRVVARVRDPVATVSSWRRLGWTPRLAELLAQPALVRDRLAPVRGRVGSGLRHLGRVGWQVMCWVVSPAGLSKTATRRLDSRANLAVWYERLTLGAAVPGPTLDHELAGRLSTRTSP